MRLRLVRRLPKRYILWEIIIAQIIHPAVSCPNAREGVFREIEEDVQVKAEDDTGVVEVNPTFIAIAQLDFVRRAVLKDTMHGILYAQITAD